MTQQKHHTSAAPPTTIVIAWPGPPFSMLAQDRLLTEQMPIDSRMSRYSGMRKLDERVRRWGLIPGKCSEKPVPIEVLCVRL